MRKALSKKTRFDVFKRDCFICQYCGSTPPSVVLQIDHINPVSNGGTNDIDNLITACFECNNGKSDGLLSVAPKTIDEKHAILREKELQIKEFMRLQKRIRIRIEKQVDEVESVFQDYFIHQYFTARFRTSVKNFAERLPLNEILAAMECACFKFDSAQDAVKYFCGICWNKIRESESE